MTKVISKPSTVNLIITLVTLSIIVLLMITKYRSSIKYIEEPRKTNSSRRNTTDYSYLAPLTDEFQLYGYSNRIKDGICISIESAILAGWTYQLVGPTIKVPNQDGDSKMNKLEALSILMKILPSNVTFVFVDSLDVLFQHSFLEFQKAYRKNNHDKDGIIFGSENNCWPFNRSNKKTYDCPLMQGKNWKSESKEPALGCKLQESIYKKYKSTRNDGVISNSDSIYLNAGLSIGVVGTYSKIVKEAVYMLDYYPSLCMEDQGLFAWQFAKQNDTSMKLDYESSLFAGLNGREIIFDKDDGLLKLWHNDKNKGNDKNNSLLLSIPYLLHFNGAGKPKYNTTRDQVMNYKNKTMNIRRFLEDKFFYLDGIKRKFTDVCEGYVKKHYDFV